MDIDQIISKIGKPAIAKNNIYVYNDDALNILKRLPNSVIDTILTDPPYDMNKYMPVLPDNYKMEIAKQFKRVLNISGNLILFCGYLDKFKWYYILNQVGLVFKREIIWIYDNPSNYPPQNNIQASHETILWFSKHNKRHYFKKAILNRTWINCPVESGFIKYQKKLPKMKNVTPKPVELIIRLLEALSPPNSLVLDCFAGSGSTGIACFKTGRKCILVEKSRETMNYILNRFKKDIFINKLDEILNGGGKNA